MEIKVQRETYVEEKLREFRESLPEEQQAFLRPPIFDNLDAERRYRKERLVGAFRLFAKFGLCDGIAGHITARDPEFSDRFWVNPLAMHFSQIRVSDLLLVNHQGEVLEGNYPVNPAAFAIHSQIHLARPDVVSVAHAHSIYGRAWSSLGRLLDPITQDACAFYNDHVVFDKYEGPSVTIEEGRIVAKALGACKAAILQNHGLLTLGRSVEECAWWYISMERCCQAQLMAEAVAPPRLIRDDVAEATYKIQGNPGIGWFNFVPLWNMISKEQPDLFD